jgi:hypothetical protein
MDKDIVKDVFNEENIKYLPKLEICGKDVFLDGNKLDGVIKYKLKTTNKRNRLYVVFGVSL